LKNIICIRHGKAFHNVLSDKIGEKAFSLKESFDAPLVEEGILQAKELGENSKQLKKIDIVFVSPLTRTLQTAENIFEKNKIVRIVALDKMKEFPQGIEICNKRRNRIELKEKFKKVDFSLLDSDSDQMWREDRYEKIEELKERIKEFKQFIMNENYNNIAIVSHNNFLKELLFQNCGDETYNLDHCNPYKLDLF
jgi:broad specificity phosphatase PhoE|tara:strand:+ start:132 stop:716 length:585 start_codon:yes stop_codon:yes gene_type:complete